MNCACLTLLKGLVSKGNSQAWGLVSLLESEKLSNLGLEQCSMITTFTKFYDENVGQNMEIGNMDDFFFCQIQQKLNEPII